MSKIAYMSDHKEKRRMNKIAYMSDHKEKWQMSKICIHVCL